MRAVVTAGAGRPLAVAEIPDPTPGPGELLVAVSRCGVCGSDLHGTDVLPPGWVLGHEIAGEIQALGPGVKGWQVGQRVVAFPLVGCGHCPACAAGRTHRCAGMQLVGFTRPGGYAELVTVGARETVPLPDSVSDADGALVEPLAVGLAAYRATGLGPGRPLLVLGGGPVGLAVAAWARRLNVGPVVVSEPAPGRRRAAEQLGAVGVDPTSDDPAAVFASLTGGPPPVVVECTGAPGLVDAAMAAAADDARIVVAGVCTIPDPVTHLTGLLKGLTLHWVLYYDRAAFDAALALLADDRFDPAPLLTGTVGLDELPDRFEALKHPGADVKIQVDPREQP